MVLSKNYVLSQSSKVFGYRLMLLELINDRICSAGLVHRVRDRTHDEDSRVNGCSMIFYFLFLIYDFSKINTLEKNIEIYPYHRLKVIPGGMLLYHNIPPVQPRDVSYLDS